MKYYTKEIWNEEGYQRTAGIKARDDVDAILELLDVSAHQVRSRLLHRGMSEECIEWVGQEHIKRVMVSTRYDHCHNSHLPFMAGPG